MLSMEELEKIAETGASWTFIEDFDNWLDRIKIGQTVYTGGGYGKFYFDKQVKKILEDSGDFIVNYHQEHILDMHGYEDDYYYTITRIADKDIKI